MCGLNPLGKVRQLYAHQRSGEIKFWKNDYLLRIPKFDVEIELLCARETRPARSALRFRLLKTAGFGFEDFQPSHKLQHDIDGIAVRINADTAQATRVLAVQEHTTKAFTFYRLKLRGRECLDSRRSN